MTIRCSYFTLFASRMLASRDNLPFIVKGVRRADILVVYSDKKSQDQCLHNHFSIMKGILSHPLQGSLFIIVFQVSQLKSSRGALSAAATDPASLLPDTSTTPKSQTKQPQLALQPSKAQRPWPALSRKLAATPSGPRDYRKLPIESLPPGSKMLNNTGRKKYERPLTDIPLAESIWYLRR
jgi:hypothetical protein